MRYLRKYTLKNRALLSPVAEVGLESFLSLRIQTVEPWKRVLCVFVGLIFGAAAFWLSTGDQTSQWLVGFFAVLAVTTVLIGAFGWKRPAEAVLNAAAEAVFSRILDTLW